MEYHVKKTYKCELCSKAFNKKSKFSIHQRIHTSIKSFKCELCSKAFIHKGALNSHLRIHTGEKPYKCELCSKVFRQQSHLIYHKRTHTGEKPYKCDFCFKSFSSKNNLNVHKRIHTGEKSFKCELCSKSFSEKSDLIVHIRIHIGETQYKCELCSKSFFVKRDLDTHKLIHTSEKPYKCEICSKTFSDKSKLIVYKRIHTGEKPIICDLCIKAFTENGSLDVHKRIHTEEKQYKCELCSKSFSVKSDLNVHIRIHNGEKTYKCELCSKSFIQKRDLDTHKRIHTGEKPYKCEICTKTFSDKSKLIVYKQIHTGEKPIICDLCFKAFTENGSLDVHKQIHTEEKPYKCELCSKSFIQKSDFIDHKRIHTGEKPLKCEHFTKSFTHGVTQIQHKRFCSSERTNNILCSTSSQKDTLKKRPLSEDASTFKADKKDKSEQSWNVLSNPKVDSKFQEKSYDMATNSIGRIDYEEKGVKFVTETFSANDDVLSTAGHLVITNVRSLQDFSSDSQSNSGTEEEKRILNLDTVGCYSENYVVEGTHLEETQSCLPKSTTEKMKGSPESSMNNFVQPFFLKSEVILSDEEDSDKWKLQNMNEIVASNNEENQKKEREIFTNCTSASLNCLGGALPGQIALAVTVPNRLHSASFNNGEEFTKNDLAIKIVGNNHLDSKDLFHVQMLLIKTRYEPSKAEQNKNVYFDSSSVSNGEIQIVCKNRETVEWCKEMIPQLPARDPTDRYRVFGPEEESLTFLVCHTKRRAAQT